MKIITVLCVTKQSDMKKTTLKKLEEKQFDLYCDYVMTEKCLEIWKEKNPNYETEYNLWVEYMNTELEIKEKKHRYEIAVSRWALEEQKQFFLSSNK